MCEDNCKQMLDVCPRKLEYSTCSPHSHSTVNKPQPEIMGREVQYWFMQEKPSVLHP